ncbi:MAG: hypothetical protein WC829_22470 [Hyphomicrobium sp.]
MMMAACLSVGLIPTQLLAGSSAASAPQPIESVKILQVDGWIQITEQGGVADFQTDSPLVPALREKLGRIVFSWRFLPVLIEGKPSSVRTRTRVVLAATPDGAGYQVRIDNVTFPRESAAAPASDDFSGRSLTPPQWPRALAGVNVAGRVLLCMRVGADGHVEQVVAVQTMLFDVRGSEVRLRRVVDQFERAALFAAKGWRFNISAERGQTLAAERTVKVPVEFVAEAKPGWDLPGQWRTIVRVPKRPVEWLPKSSDLQNVGVSDVGAGEMIPALGQVKLETDVVGALVM